MPFTFGILSRHATTSSAIEFVGGAVANKSGEGIFAPYSSIALNSGLTGGIASAVAEDDLVIAAFATGSSADRSLGIRDETINYTLIGSELYQGDTYDVNLRVAYKFMGPTPDTATYFSPTGSTSEGGAMAVYVFRGVDKTTPLDVAVTTAIGGNSLYANPPSITPSTPGAFIVVVGASGSNRLSSAFTNTELVDFLSTTGNDSSSGTIGIGHKDDWTSGPFDPAAFGHTGAASSEASWAAMSIALRPA